MEKNIDIPLKLCPFCGGEAKLVKTTECWGHGEYHEVRYVTCTKCGVKGPSVCDMEVYEKTATWDSVAARWNGRVTERKKISKRELMERNRALNEVRRKRLNGE